MIRLVSEDPIYRAMVSFAENHQGIEIEMAYEPIERIVKFKMARPGVYSGPNQCLPRCSEMKLYFELFDGITDAETDELVTKQLQIMYDELFEGSDDISEKGEKHVLQGDTQN